MPTYTPYYCARYFNLNPGEKTRIHEVGVNGYFKVWYGEGTGRGWECQC